MSVTVPRIDRRRGAPIAATGMLIVSTESLLTRLADAEPFDIAAPVGLLTATVIAVVIAGSGGPGLVDRLRAGGAPLAAAGLLQGATVLCFIVALTRTSVSNVVVIIAAAPLLAAVTAWALLGERPTARASVAVGSSIVGIGIVISGSLGGGTLGGDLVAVAAITSYAFGLVVLRRHPELDPLLVVGCGAAAMGLVSIWPATWGGHDASTWWAIVAMGVVSGPVSRVLLATAPRYLPASEVGLFAPIETVLAPVWAYLAFDEVPRARTVAGGALIVVVVVYAVWPRAGERPSRAVATAGVRSAP